MKRFIIGVATCAAVLLQASQVFPQSLATAKFALHVKTRVDKSTEICTVNDPNSQGIPCSQYTTAWPAGVSADVYLVIGQVNSVGVNGVRLGIDYNGAPGAGLDEFGWTLCTDGLEFPNAGPNGVWPAAGGGNTITWLTCQQTVIDPEGIHAVVGSFYLYAYGPDTFSITPNNNLLSGAELQLSDCNGQITDFPLDTITGAVDFGGGYGVNPCTDIEPPPPPPVPPALSFNIEPGQCPSEIVDGNGGFVTAAIVCSHSSQASTIVPSSVRVAGIPVARTKIRDVATYAAGDSCQCHAEGGDGLDDLELKISRRDLLDVIGPVGPGDVVGLTVTGELTSGTPFSAGDCAVIVSQGGGPKASRVELSSNDGSPAAPRISYTLPRDGKVRMSIFDVSGRQVSELVNGFRTAGTHVLDWDAADRPNGIYFYRLMFEDRKETRKLVLLK